jgi:hypothetical protein
MVGNSATRLACEFQRTEGRRHVSTMKPQGGKSIEAPSLRGLQGRSATGLSGQAAKEELSAMWRGAGCRKNISGVPAGRSVFPLTSPLIGLLNTCGGYWTHRQSLCLRRFLRPSLTEAPSLHRHYPVSSVCEPLRHPRQPGLALASCQLIPTAITAGASRVASGPLCLHAVATTPAGSMEHARSCLSIDRGLPCEKVRSAPAIVVSGPAQRSLMLRPARSPSH